MSATAPDGAGDATAPRQPTIEERAGTCPVNVLGQDDGVYFFLTPDGQLRALKTRQLDSTGIMSIFGQEISWLWDAFPHTDSKGDQTGWRLQAAQEWLFRRAHAVGFFRADQVRGPGVWRAADSDGGIALVVHCGDAVMLPGPTPGLQVWRGAGLQHENFIYPASPPETRPAPTAASAVQMSEISEFIQSWAWRSPVHAPRLLLGFIAAAAISGALEWRPHILVAGGPGTGKTTLLDFTRQLLGSMVLSVSAPTEAGVRQLLKGAARPVMVDEMETDNMERARRMIELARIGSSDSQAAVARGGADGKATQWPVRANFLFSSNLYPRLRPQDLSRICVLELDKLPIGERADGEMTQRWADRRLIELARLGPGLRRRMIDGFARFDANLQVYEQALSSLGQRARVAAQLGTLLACADTLLADTITTAVEASAIVDDFAIPDITGHTDEEDHQDFLAHLLTWPVRVSFEAAGATDLAIGELVQRSRGAEGGRYDEALRIHGLAVRRVKIGDAEFPHLVVANNHQGLVRIFAGTRWADGTWQQAAQRVPDAARYGPVNFAGIKQRGIWLPFTSLPVEWEVRS